MPMINLLPWREELRQKRKKEFALAALFAVLAGAGLTMGTKLFYQAQISSQESRNEMLRAEITELDKQIEEIEELDAQKDRLIARMEIIEELQRSRPEAVHLLDEAIEIMPEGTHMTSLTQEGNRIEIEGMAQSSTRVSSIMRNIFESEWLKDEELGDIAYTDSGPDREGAFTLFANQIRMNENGEAGE
jgi:type IV pilus assembly protein PilN